MIKPIYYILAGAILVCASAAIIFGTMNQEKIATQSQASKEKISKYLATIRSDPVPEARVGAAESLFKFVSQNGSSNLSDGQFSNIVSLLDSTIDAVRYWIARSLGALGARAKPAIPKLREVLAKVDCLGGGKTSASGIRFALVQMGEEKPPYPVCFPPSNTDNAR